MSARTIPSSCWGLARLFANKRGVPARMLLSSALSIVLIALAGWAEGLNHGRDAKQGEFPYVVRVRIADLENDARRIAAGVLITLTRVLTTCDTVGYFTSERVHRHNLSRVELKAGSVYREISKGGQLLKPIESNTHPWCHLLASEIVLFNLGFFILSDPGFTPTIFLKPVDKFFSSKEEMINSFYSFYYVRDTLKCQAAGWGYPTMAFEDKVEPDYFNSSSEVLQVADMEVVPFEGPTGCAATTCQEFGDCLLNIWEYGMVCAKARRGGPCRNDKGAPLVCGNILVAIHTNPQRCEDEGIPRHFVRLDLVYDYVYNTTSQGLSIAAAKLLLLATVAAIAIVVPDFQGYASSLS